MSTFALILPYIHHTVGTILCYFNHIPGKIYMTPNCPAETVVKLPMVHYHT
jgi:hypothetical protein